MIGGGELCDSVIGDLNDSKTLNRTILEFDPDVILHFAAQPLVRKSYVDPIETYTTNAIGTAQLLEGVRQLNKECQVVLITTDKVYHNQEWSFAYRENDRLGGYDPYSCSKACAELIIDSYRNSFFNIDSFEKHRKSIASARAGNVIGGGDMAKDRIIPDIVRALSNSEDIHVRNPLAIRPWQHVIEPLWGYLTLAYHMSQDPILYQDAFNFGPRSQDCVTVGHLVDLAIANWGNGRASYASNNNAPHEAGLLKLDISKTEHFLQWSPIFDAATAIEMTISWYKEVLDGRNAMDMTISDINTYMAKVQE
jgi:CDP-glucose 4,6-dehydratase